MRRLAVALVLVLAGCAAEPLPVPTQHTPLRAALARVAATDVTRRHVEYADIQAIEAVTSDGPWQRLGPHRRNTLGDQAEASLTAITLAADPEISKLADCLGDVLVAKIIFHYPGESLRYHAAGIRRTTDKASTPHVVLCSSWASGDDADDAADRQADELKTPHFADIYRNSKVERLDGDLVRLEADTPNDPAAVLADMSPKELPGLLRR